MSSGNICSFGSESGGFIEFFHSKNAKAFAIYRRSFQDLGEHQTFISSNFLVFWTKDII